MAKKLVPMEISGGGTMFVEVDAPPMVGKRPVSLPPLGKIDFAAALEPIKLAASQLFHVIDGIAMPPDDCEISFGIKLSAEAGVFLASAGTEANFEIKLNWSRKDHKSDTHKSGTPNEQ
jgi:hypothetical protein